jgi:uncharacterized delta-60 repeat protein
MFTGRYKSNGRTGELRPPAQISPHRYLGGHFQPRLEVLESRTLLSAGELDPTFGTGGKVVTDFGAGSKNVVDAVAVQPDGKIIVAGKTQPTPSSHSRLALARFNSDGSLDPGFGTGGKTTTDFDPLAAEAVGVCIQPDGNIVVVGQQADENRFGPIVRILLAGYNPDGTLDTTFGTDGKVVDAVSVRPMSVLSEVSGVACQADGKILVEAGSNGISTAGGPTFILRYNVDGSRDLGFGSGGIVGISNFTGQGIAVQPDGKIVAGVQQNYLLRLNPDGSPDPSFGRDGLAFGASGTHSILLQPDGRIVSLGIDQRQNPLIRFNVNGTLDTSFGPDGTVSNPSMILNVGALETDGKLVRATTTNAMFELSRYDPDGSLDTGFGVNGEVTTGFDTASIVSLAGVVIQPDGKIVAAGTVTGAATNFGLARYLSDDRSADPNQRYVSQVYLDLLQRSADASGLATWSAFLNQGNSRTSMVQAIQGSTEYHTLVVRQLYGYVLGRPVDDSGRNTWVRFLNQGGTVEQLEAYLLGSEEYFTRPLGGNGTNDVFLEGIYRDLLHRAIDPSGMQSLGQALAKDTSRSVVATFVMTSLESDQMEVQSLYSRFLRRTADHGGLDAFSSALQRGVSHELIIAALLGSDEYFSRARTRTPLSGAATAP